MANVWFSIDIGNSSRDVGMFFSHRYIIPLGAIFVVSRPTYALRSDAIHTGNDSKTASSVAHAMRKIVVACHGIDWRYMNIASQNAST